MISRKKENLIVCPHKVIIKRNLFDFIRNRENMNLCENTKSELIPLFKMVCF